MQRLVILAYC